VISAREQGVLIRLSVISRGSSEVGSKKTGSSGPGSRARTCREKRQAAPAVAGRFDNKPSVLFPPALLDTGFVLRCLSLYRRLLLRHARHDALDDDNAPGGCER
jgi:hypothetical protein